MNITYPDLPISRRRNDILAAMREHQVIVVVGETGSGKTTQLPKMAMELAGEARGRVGCTQPRRLAAASVSRRVAEELNCDLGGLVGYQVRFEEKTGLDTRLKFMTDGILLAETQHDPDLRQYHTLILDEAHERSLNIDFLLGYLRLLLDRRRDLRLVISSATLDAGGFSEFFGGAPIIQVEGRTYPVDLHYLPPQHDDEELPAHVARAVDWLDTLDDRGDVLVFLPGEQEIREVAEKLEGRNLRNTRILPLFARLGLADQQRIFHPEQGYRRIVLATNVAETSLTIPGIIYVIDSGLARVSRYSPARQVQRLQIEPVSKASARQRAGRCGRVCEGVCIRLYSEKDWEDRPDFTDPEIRRSALAGALLRMKDLGLPEMPEFPLPDPPSSKLVTEGYRTLREIGALDKARQLTPVGRKLARLPIDPRLARMLLEAQHEQALPEMLVIVAGLGIMDPRERPADAAQKADQAHAQWKEEDSDFLSLLKLWKAAWQFREGRRWRKNQLRKWCGKNFLNFNRMMEWFNLWEDLSRLVRETLKCRISPLEEETERQASFAMIHRSILAGVPRQFGLWDADNREYRGAGGRSFGIFPGSGLFRRKKRSEWVMGVELVDTTRLWMRRASILEPEWVERVAPHLCESHYSGARWDREQGAVYAVERVVCGGLRIIDNRRVHYGRINPAHAREIMIREGLLGGGFRTKPACIRHLETLREEVRQIELKLRRPDQVWCEEGVFEFFNRLVPPDCCTARAFLRWAAGVEKKNPEALHVPPQEAMYEFWGKDLLDGFPDEITCKGAEYAVYYQNDPGAEDDGVTLGVHIDQLPDIPEWLPEWGVPGHLAQRAECLLRSLPKDLRVFLQPISQKAAYFAELRHGLEPDGPLAGKLAEFVEVETGKFCAPSFFDMNRLPAELVTKIWVCDDEGEELAMGTDVAELNNRLGKKLSRRFQETAEDIVSVTGMKEWSCGDLEYTVDVAGRPGYVALVDEGASVGVRVFEDELSAAESHREGCLRFMRLRQTDQLNHLRRKFPLKLEGKLSLHMLGREPSTNAEDLVDVAAEIAMGRPLPRTAEQFAAAEMNLRQNLFDAAHNVADIWELVAGTEHAVRDFTALQKGVRHTERITADLQRQLDWLLRPRFLWAHGAERLPDLKRYMQGIAERIRRIGQQPLARELERLDLFERVYFPWHQVLKEHAGDLRWMQYGYLLEEYRLAVFAPAISVKGRVSEKRLVASFEALSSQ